MTAAIGASPLSVSPTRHYPGGMEPNVSTEQDGVYDPHVGMVVTAAGKRRWRERLDEADANRDHAAREALKQRLGLHPKSA